MGMKRVIAVSVLAALAAGTARAEGTSGVLSWFKNWKNSLERSAVEGKYRKMRTATGVAAVRGNPLVRVDPAEAYWKGGWSEKREKERVQERGELAAAAALLEGGQRDEGGAALDAFEKAHPKSSFLGDVKEARAKLDEMDGKAPAPAAEPKAAAEPKPEEPKAEAPKADEPKAPEAPEPQAAAATDAPPAEPAKADAPPAP